MTFASARVRRAMATWRCSIIRPSTVTTPSPSASAAANGVDHPLRPCSTSSAGRRPRRVGRLDLARGGRGLAVEAELDALAALGGEALGVADVVVDAVEDDLAGLAGGSRSPSPGTAPGCCARRLSGPAARWPGRWCPSRAPDTRGWAASRPDVEDRRRRLDHRPDRHVPSPPPASSRAATSSRWARSSRPSGSRPPPAAAAPAAARSAAPHCVVEPVAADRQLAVAVGARRRPRRPPARGPAPWRRARRRPRGRR